MERVVIQPKISLDAKKKLKSLAGKMNITVNQLVENMILNIDEDNLLMINH